MKAARVYGFNGFDVTEFRTKRGASVECGGKRARIARSSVLDFALGPQALQDIVRVHQDDVADRLSATREDPDEVELLAPE